MNIKSQPERIPMAKLFAYGVGNFGWSLSINIISALLLYLYLPPGNSGMQNLVPQITVFGVINIIAFIMAGGRLFDAVVDPVIANYSDRSTHPKGRRIPLMMKAVIPMTVFSILLFFPPFRSCNGWNLVWLAVIEAGYYFFFSLYVIPNNALLAELGHYPNGKMQISTVQAIGFIVGVVFSTIAPAIGDSFQEVFHIVDRFTAMQYAIVLVNVIGGLCMLVPVLAIDEKRYTKPGAANDPLLPSLKIAFANRNFVAFAISDAAFFFSVAIVTTGLLYYLRVMLNQPEAYGTPLMACMVATTLVMYFFVGRLEKRFGKKKLMVGAFLGLSLVFAGVYNLGRYPVSPIIQAIVLMVSCGMFNSILIILPNLVVAEIATEDAKVTGQNKEGLYFGMRALFQKLGQTMGIMLFAVLTMYGKDPGDDYGLRLSGVVGFVLCLIAAFSFSQYREPEKAD
jgi:GPH family glycoside/pentoside/hexuronide:cation symporter